MAHSAKKLILAAALGGAALMSGCAVDPYYDNYGYGYDRGYAYGYDYANPYYVAPSVGFGFSYSDGYDRRYYRGDRGNWRDRDGRDGWRDRGDRGDRDGWRDRNGAWHEDPRDRHGENSPG